MGKKIPWRHRIAAPRADASGLRRGRRRGKRRWGGGGGGRKGGGGGGGGGERRRLAANGEAMSPSKGQSVTACTLTLKERRSSLFNIRARTASASPLAR